MVLKSNLGNIARSIHSQIHQIYNFAKMASRHRFITSLPLTTVIAVNISISALGLLLVFLPFTIRRDLSVFATRHFPIYPEGRPTSGSSKAPYFPAHLSTSDNAAQLALGAISALCGSVASTVLYLQWTRPSEFSKSYHKLAGWVAMIAAGASTAVIALIVTGMSFGNQEGSGIDLTSVGYWPWQNMFPTINWSIEGWTCKVHSQLDLPVGSPAAADFSQMCEYARMSKWITLALLFLGVSAMGIGFSALAEQRCLERCELADLRAEAFREAEKSDKRLV